MGSSHSLRLYTDPRWLPFACRYLPASACLSVEALRDLPPDAVVSDLHNRSCPVAEYRAVARQTRAQLRTTLDRAAWLGRSTDTFPRRQHAAESIFGYWQRVLEVSTTASHQPTARPARRHRGDVLLSFQSTTRTKGLPDGEAARIVRDIASRAPTTLIEGPGKRYSMDLVAQAAGAGAGLTRIGSPGEFLALARDARLLVAVDNGLRHVAALVDLPTIVLYGPTSSATCGSGEGEVSVAATTRCAPCGELDSCQNIDFGVCMTGRDDTLLRRQLRNYV